MFSVTQNENDGSVTIVSDEKDAKWLHDILIAYAEAAPTAFGVPAQHYAICLADAVAEQIAYKVGDRGRANNPRPFDQAPIVFTDLPVMKKLLGPR